MRSPVCIYIYVLAEIKLLKSISEFSGFENIKIAWHAPKCVSLQNVDVGQYL